MILFYIQFLSFPVSKISTFASSSELLVLTFVSLTKFDYETFLCVSAKCILQFV